MKRIVIYSLVLLFIYCSENKNMSPQKLLRKAFSQKDELALKKRTTSEGYASLIMVQNMLLDSDKEIEVEILEESIDIEIA